MIRVYHSRQLFHFICLLSSLEHSTELIYFCLSELSVLYGIARPVSMSLLALSVLPDFCKVSDPFISLSPQCSLHIARLLTLPLEKRICIDRAGFLPVQYISAPVPFSCCDSSGYLVSWPHMFSEWFFIAHPSRFVILALKLKLYFCVIWSVNEFRDAKAVFIIIPSKEFWTLLTQSYLVGFLITGIPILDTSGNGIIFVRSWHTHDFFCSIVILFDSLLLVKERISVDFVWKSRFWDSSQFSFWTHFLFL